MPAHRPYDILTCIKRNSDVPPGRWGMKADPDEARRDFADFCPEARELLSHIDTAVEWTLAGLPALETYHSEDGQTILVGDSAHAMMPHSGSGGNSAIEDAACVAECLDWAHRQGKDLIIAARASEHLRKARVERMQAASREGYAFLGASGGFLPVRDQMLREQLNATEEEFKLPEEVVRRAKAKEFKPDMNAMFPATEYLLWLYGYDAIQVAGEYLAGLE